jgi:hypothetical protein
VADVCARKSIFLRQAVAFGLTFVALLLMAEAASAAPPTLSRVFPPGGQRGAKVVVTCVGTFSWPVKVWSPGVETVVTKDNGKVELSIPADLPTDRIWLRLHNAEGASAAVPFLIGSLPEAKEKEPNNAPSTAQQIAASGVTVSGVLEKTGDVDAFAVPLEAGQTLVAAVDANSRLGSPIDAILQVASADGTVLAENHDDIGLDPRLAFTATKSAVHLVRIFAFPAMPDSAIALRGGPDCVYRLTVTTGPFVTHAVPLAAHVAEPGSAQVRGWNLPTDAKLTVAPLGGARLAEHAECEALTRLGNSPASRLGFAFSPQWGGAARVRLVPHPVMTDLAQTSSKSPLSLTLPTVVTGHLQTRQPDEFRLPLKKGQRALLSVEARSLDFPLDPMLKLLDPAGKLLAEVDDAPRSTRDAAIAQAAAQDGDYRLIVSDRHGQGGERYFYRLTARIEEPDFDLSAASDAIVVTPGKPTELTINVRRVAAGSGIGRIRIAAVDLPSGLTAPPVVSEPTGPTAAKVTLTLTTTGPAFSGTIRIAGTATQPTEIRRFVRTPVNLEASLETIWLTVLAKP